QYLLQQSQAVLWIMDQEINIESSSVKLTWANLNDQFSTFPSTAPNISINSTAPCYLIYTSGTSGFPKGVLIAHQSFVNYLHWFTQTHQITQQDRTVLFSSMAFDLGLTVLWSALTRGALLHLIDPEETWSFFESANEYLMNQQITYLKCTPAHFKLIVNAVDFQEWVDRHQLRLIFLGGEAIDAKDVQLYLKNREKTLIVNEYGPTEMTVGMVAKTIDASNAFRFQQLPVIGQPVAGHEVYILDKDGRPLSIGEFGELYLVGPGKALGYIHQTDLTSQAFAPLSILEGTQTVAYASGDRGRWLPTGDIQLAGRMDQQVKIRGYRIELEEINQQLKKLEGVQTAHTLVVAL
ncbi:MAG: AMP-binding protein, partial [Bacteroidota bacterium]